GAWRTPTPRRSTCAIRVAPPEVTTRRASAECSLRCTAAGLPSDPLGAGPLRSVCVGAAAARGAVRCRVAGVRRVAAPPPAAGLNEQHGVRLERLVPYPWSPILDAF